MLYVDDAPAGWRCWRYARRALLLRWVPGLCRRSGVRLALPLTLALLEQARRCGACSMTLIVLEQNERAIKTYQRAGVFDLARDPLLPDGRVEVLAPAAHGELVSAAVADLLALGHPDLAAGVADLVARRAHAWRAGRGWKGALIYEGAIVAYLLLRRARRRGRSSFDRRARLPTPPTHWIQAPTPERSHHLPQQAADSPGALAMDALGFARAFRL